MSTIKYIVASIMMLLIFTVLCIAAVGTKLGAIGFMILLGFLFKDYLEKSSSSMFLEKDE